ncbi:MAG: WD40 repeat domain-containing protein [Candidatus Hodarchaeales archaeon]|jgi:WD40 repeat protein
MELNKFISVLVYLLLLTSLFTSTCRSENNETNIARNIRSIEINQDEFTEKTLIGHTSEIWDVGFSPDGELLASASSDNSILVWNASTGTIYQNLTGHQDSVYSLAFHPHDFVLASGSFDRTILIWNLTSGEIMGNFTGHTSSIWSLDFSPDGLYLASGSGDSTVRIWDYTSSNSLLNLTGHTEVVKSVQFLSNGLLASGSYDDSILLWNITSGSLETIISNNSDNILSIAGNPAGTTLASGSQDNLLEFWDLSNYGFRTRNAFSLGDWVRAVAYSDNGYFLASGLQDGEIQIWEGTTAYSVRNLTGHTQSIRGLDFHPTQALLASVSGDQTIKLWNVTDLDQDQLPDYWELENGLSPQNEYDWASDHDSDGLSNINEYLFGTDPQNADSDFDQMSDYYEFLYGLNGNLPDASGDIDQDGMPNLYEYLHGLDSGGDDSALDRDNDGMPNLFEYENGLKAGVHDADGDLDNDGLTNIYEYRNNFIIGVDDGGNDADSDGLTNREEFLIGTNPRDPDSDNDFFNDHIEEMLGSDPLNFISNPITLLLGILLIISLLIFVLFSAIKNYPKIKAKSIKYGRDIKTKTKETLEYFRPKPQQTWVQDLAKGKAIHIDTLSSELATGKLKLPQTVKASLTPLRLNNHSLVLRSDLLLLEPTPPKEATCQVCIGEINERNYLQCKSCKRFVCIHDYVDLITVGSPNCPNCSGELILFPFSCQGCGLDFSSVTEITGKSGCPLCGYTLVDQPNLIKKVTAGIRPSKITQSLQMGNEKDTKHEKIGKK